LATLASNWFDYNCPNDYEKTFWTAT
jgi:hypothetical protein